MEVVSVERKSPVLAPSSLACLSTIPTINLTAGCAHGCLYCYTQGYRTHPGEKQVHLYANALALLDEELRRKRRLPLAVYFSPSSDLFQPQPEILDLACGILETLLTRGIGVAFLTKGEIPERHLSLLLAHPRRVRAQIGLSTLNDRLLRLFEPGAANAQTRLNQAHALVAADIPTEIRLDPILPGLTDDEASLSRLCQAIAEAGVRRIAASLLFLRPAVLTALEKRLPEPERSRLLSAYSNHSIHLPIQAERSSVMTLSHDERLAIYDRVRRIAQQHGLHTTVCGCKNPDLTTTRCNIAGDWHVAEDLFAE